MDIWCQTPLISSLQMVWPSTVHPVFLDQIPQKPTINSLDLPPTMEVVGKAGNQSSSNKVPWMDRISNERYKAAGSFKLKIFQGFLITIWEEEHMLKDFKNAKDALLFQKKVVKLTVGITWASPSYPLQTRFWHVPFCTTISPPFQRKTYHRCSVVPNLTAAPSTWFLKSNSSSRSVSNRIWICMLPL